MKNLNQVKNAVQLARLVVTTFLEEAESPSDLNQVAFNTIIKQTLQTADFSDAFEKLLVRSKFQMDIVQCVFSPSSAECVFDVYSVDSEGVGNYTDERLADSVMGVVLPKSRLLARLINEAYDYDQQDYVA
jgi:hypothetical protein